MKHTKNEILTKAETILKDLQGEYFTTKSIEEVQYQEKKEVARPRGEILSIWKVTIKESIFGSPDFLTISDDNGEPLYYQNSHQISEIKQDLTGKYIYVD